MLFSSPVFFLFFAAYFALHLLLGARFRIPLIIAGSTFFYGYWNPFYFWIPYALTLVAYLGALWLDGSDSDRSRRNRMALCVTVLLLPLGLVKYTDFVLQDLVGPVLDLSVSPFDLALPLGISFITFTMIAYVVDVYRGHYPVERRLSRLTALVLFFPHLIAGPILRPGEFLPQLERARGVLRGLRVRVVFGLAIFSVGLLKKLVFADPTSEVVDLVYAGGPGITAPEYLLAIYGFSVQIYCDFSGYTDMAIGLAILIGIRLPTNFMHPYTSSSITEFWRRWHITLSKWLRDYLYIPLGGNRKGRGRELANVLITMTLGGLWHGANWTFVLWGVVHGVGISLSHLAKWSGLGIVSNRVPRWVQVVVSFHFVTFAWILFRAPDVETAWRVARGAFTAPMGDLADFAGSHAFALSLLVVFLLTHRFDDHRQIRRLTQKLPVPVLWPAIAFIWILAITVSAGSSAKFIYFDF